MSKEKQIEEMANIMCTLGETNCQECAIHWERSTVPKCDLVKRAEVLYNAGYSKASDVAKNIITELLEITNWSIKLNNNLKEVILESNVPYLKANLSFVEGKLYSLRGIEMVLKELKKKYEENNV